MKGVILGINENVNLVDITHGITPYGIMEAALVIGMNYSYFPRGTIHVCVVDPGVGSPRRPIIVASDGHLFVGPDNGIFSRLLAGAEAVHITEDRYVLRKESSTFHGRDIFAPVAAWLSKGIPAHEFGPAIRDAVRIELPEPDRSQPETVRGEILFIDHFGNAITNIHRSHLEAFPGSPPRIRWKDRIIELRHWYADAADGGLAALVNSNGLIEFFVYRGNAAAEYGLAVGDPVDVSR